MAFLGFPWLLQLGMACRYYGAGFQGHLRYVDYDPRVDERNRPYQAFLCILISVFVGRQSTESTKYSPLTLKN